MNIQTNIINIFSCSMYDCQLCGNVLTLLQDKSHGLNSNLSLRNHRWKSESAKSGSKGDVEQVANKTPA